MVLDPATIFALEVAENNSKLKEQSGIDTLEISDDYFYSIESEVGINYLKQKQLTGKIVINVINVCSFEELLCKHRYVFVKNRHIPNDVSAKRTFTNGRVTFKYSS